MSDLIQDQRALQGIKPDLVDEFSNSITLILLLGDQMRKLQMSREPSNSRSARNLHLMP